MAWLISMTKTQTGEGNRGDPYRQDWACLRDRRKTDREVEAPPARP